MPTSLAAGLLHSPTGPGLQATVGQQALLCVRQACDTDRAGALAFQEAGRLWIWPPHKASRQA